MFFMIKQNFILLCKGLSSFQYTLINMIDTLNMKKTAYLLQRLN